MKPVDVGDTCRRGIRNYLLTGEVETPFNEWDAGNGALMRMLPVAIFTLGDDWLMKGRVVAQDTMQTVLYHFFRGSGFEECLVP